jgi:hypothetical protein
LSSSLHQLRANCLGRHSTKNSEEPDSRSTSGFNLSLDHAVIHLTLAALILMGPVCIPGRHLDAPVRESDGVNTLWRRRGAVVYRAPTEKVEGDNTLKIEIGSYGKSTGN